MQKNKALWILADDHVNFCDKLICVFNQIGSDEIAFKRLACQYDSVFLCIGQSPVVGLHDFLIAAKVYGGETRVFRHDLDLAVSDLGFFNRIKNLKVGGNIKKLVAEMVIKECSQFTGNLQVARVHIIFQLYFILQKEVADIGAAVMIGKGNESGRIDFTFHLSGSGGQIIIKLV